MDRKTKGRLAEAAVLKYCIEMGYEPYLPFCDNTKYDMLLVIDGQVNRVSIKYTSVKVASGKWEVALRQVSRRNNSEVQIDKFDSQIYDYLAVYIGPEDRVVLVPCTFTATSSIRIA